MVLPLNRLESGENGTIVWLAGSQTTRQRLFAIGFTPGECIFCIAKASRKEPGAYLIHDTVIALRDNNAGEIFIRLTKKK